MATLTLDNKKKAQSNIIGFNKEGNVPKLIKWLEGREWNRVNKRGRDKKDNPMIGLMYENSKGHTYKRGVIVCKSDELHAIALQVVEKLQKED